MLKKTKNMQKQSEFRNRVYSTSIDKYCTQSQISKSKNKYIEELKNKRQANYMRLASTKDFNQESRIINHSKPKPTLISSRGPLSKPPSQKLTPKMNSSCSFINSRSNKVGRLNVSEISTRKMNMNKSLQKLSSSTKRNKCRNEL